MAEADAEGGASKGCIMRDMEAVHFCSVCTEALWRRLLAKPKQSPLLYALTATGIGGAPTKRVTRVAVQHGAFGKWRATPRAVSEEELRIAWHRDGARVAALDGIDAFDRVDARGCWSVRVQLLTSDVRASDAAMRALLVAEAAICVAGRGEPAGVWRAGLQCAASCVAGPLPLVAPAAAAAAAVAAAPAAAASAAAAPAAAAPAAAAPVAPRIAALLPADTVHTERVKVLDIDADAARSTLGSGSHDDDAAVGIPVPARDEAVVLFGLVEDEAVVLVGVIVVVLLLYCFGCVGIAPASKRDA